MSEDNNKGITPAYINVNSYDDFIGKRNTEMISKLVMDVKEQDFDEAFTTVLNTFRQILPHQIIVGNLDIKHLEDSQ